MGKAKKIKVSQESRPMKIGLAEQIEEGRLAKSKDRKKIRLRNDEDEEVRNDFSVIKTYSF